MSTVQCYLPPPPRRLDWETLPRLIWLCEAAAGGDYGGAAKAGNLALVESSCVYTGGWHRGFGAAASEVVNVVCRGVVAAATPLRTTLGRRATRKQEEVMVAAAVAFYAAAVNRVGVCGAVAGGGAACGEERDTTTAGSSAHAGQLRTKTSQCEHISMDRLVDEHPVDVKRMGNN